MIDDYSKTKLVIFDLDDTLCFSEYKLCNDNVVWILDYLKNDNHILAIASHNENAESIAKKCGIFDYFDKIVGYCPSSLNKKLLVDEIIRDTQLNHPNFVNVFDNTIFFDDLKQNIDEIRAYGIKSHKVDHTKGVTILDICEMDL